jgi:hypothetical protein
VNDGCSVGRSGGDDRRRFLRERGAVFNGGVRRRFLYERRAVFNGGGCLRFSELADFRERCARLLCELSFATLRSTLVRIPRVS